MAEQFTGKCVGGPHDGQMLAHWSKAKKFYRPMVDAMSMNGSAPIESVEIGEYHLNNFGQWHWWATEAGRAQTWNRGAMTTMQTKKISELCTRGNIIAYDYKCVPYQAAK